MPVFAITAATNTVTLNSKGRGTNSFTVSNASGRPLRARAEVKALNAAQQSWLTVEGETERRFPPGGTHQFAISIAVPEGSREGSYAFRLDIISVDNPDEDFAEGPPISFTVAAPPPKKPFPWWIPVAAIVLIGVAIGAWLLLSNRTPDVSGLEVKAAQTKLAEDDYKIARVIKRLTGLKQPGTVLDAKFDTDAKTADLYVEPYLVYTNGLPSDPLKDFKIAVEVPDFTTGDIRQAALRIADLQLKYKAVVEDALAPATDNVVAQSPAAKTIVDPGEQLALVYVMQAPSGPSNRDLFKDAVIGETSGILNGFVLPNLFEGGGVCYGGESGNTLFRDGAPIGTVHFAEFSSKTPVKLAAVRLFATHDRQGSCTGPPNPPGEPQRGMSAFRLLAKLKKDDQFAEVLKVELSRPYQYINNIQPLVVEKDSLTVEAQFFRVEFTQSGTYGPRIIELDGFGIPLLNQ